MEWQSAELCFVKSLFVCQVKHCKAPLPGICIFDTTLLVVELLQCRRGIPMPKTPKEHICCLVFQLHLITPGSKIKVVIMNFCSVFVPLTMLLRICAMRGVSISPLNIANPILFTRTESVCSNSREPSFCIKSMPTLLWEENHSCRL